MRGGYGREIYDVASENSRPTYASSQIGYRDAENGENETEKQESWERTKMVKMIGKRWQQMNPKQNSVGEQMVVNEGIEVHYWQ